MNPYPAAGAIGSRILAPSILSADFCCLKEQVAVTARGGAQFVHFDVMDGTFVKQISFGQPVLSSLRPETDLFLDVHLMVVHPETQVESFAKAGADGITFHLEATEDPLGLLKRIHELGVRTGLSIKPATPVEAVYPYLTDVDMVLIMTVEPGAGGQAFRGCIGCGDHVETRNGVTVAGIVFRVVVKHILGYQQYISFP